MLLLLVLEHLLGVCQICLCRQIGRIPDQRLLVGLYRLVILLHGKEGVAQVEEVLRSGCALALMLEHRVLLFDLLFCSLLWKRACSPPPVRSKRYPGNCVCYPGINLHRAFNVLLAVERVSEIVVAFDRN